jgi:hypothetical protein
MFHRLPQEKEENSATDCPKKRKKIILQIASRGGGNSYAGCPKRRRKIIFTDCPKKRKK